MFLTTPSGSRKELREMVGDAAISLYLLWIQRDLGEIEIRTLWDLFCAKSRNCTTKCVPIENGWLHNGYTH